MSDDRDHRGHDPRQYRGGEGKDAPHSRDCPYCGKENILLPYHLPCDGVADPDDVGADP